MIEQAERSYEDGVMSAPWWRRLLLAVMVAVAEAGCAASPMLPAQAPAPFFITFEKGERAACCGLALVGEGGVVVVGRADTVAGRSWAWASKFSRLGSTEWELDWSSSRENSDLFAAAAVDRGAVIATGAIGVRGSEGSPPRQGGLIVKIGPTGSLVWTRTLDLGEWTEVRGVMSDGTGGVVIAGTFQDQPNVWSLFMARVTGGGDVSQSMVIAQDRDRGVRAVHGVAGHGYVMISGSGDVIRLDSAGRFRWRRVVGDAMDAVVLPDGSLIVVSYSGDETSGAELLRLDPHGDKVWERRLKHSAFCARSGAWIWARRGDGVIVAGNSCDRSGSLWFAVVTGSGEERLTRRVLVSPKSGALRVRPGANGSVLAAGMFLQDDSPDARKGWLFSSERILSGGINLLD